MHSSYINEINRRIFIPCTNLEEICKIIPEEYFTPFEFTHANAFYGMDHALKQYANLPITYHLKAHYSHNSFVLTKGTECKRDYNLLPMLFTWSPAQQKIYKMVSNKPMYPIGPIIHYVRNYYTEEQVQAEKERLGKNALFFPAHSTYYASAQFSIEQCLECLEEYKKHFDCIRVSIYWKDFYAGLHKPFTDAGYECVSSGHLFDPLFLQRVKGLLSIADHTFGNSYGTNIVYGIYMQKPHTHIPMGVQYDLSRTPYTAPDKYAQRREFLMNKFLDKFIGYNQTISDEQYTLCSQYFGYDCVRSSSELLSLIKIAENLFQNLEGS